YILSKSGTIKLFDPKTNTSTTAGTITVSDVREDGLHSLVLDPDFATNRHVFLLYGSLAPVSALVVARYTVLATGILDLSSRVQVLSVPYSLTSSDEHNTGCLAFDPQGNLYIGLADNTNNFFSGTTAGYSPRDPKRQNYDAQRSAANSNDLRGKILRIHPETDGSYTIPSGNLFSSGTEKTRPEIYAMGLRHPFRITVDAKTGWLYWAEPGPNATADDPTKGPRGYEEVNLAKSPGYYGWPYCVGNNFCYREWNYETSTAGPAYVPDALHNMSSNNTGIQDLPPARPALIWYPYNSAGTAFPAFESGSTNTSMLGPVYYSDPAIASRNRIPRYFDQHLFIFDFSRSLIHAVQLDNDGAVVAVKRFWDQTTANPIKNPIDLKVGPDGAFYFLGWGDNGSYPKNAGHGNLVRLDYIGTPDAIPQGSRMEGQVAYSAWAWGNLGLARRIGIPDRAIRAEAFDLRGRCVWTWRRPMGPHPRFLDLERDGSGAPVCDLGPLRVRFSER
ncbi:MAG: PQQ-dependent sugar dehydrogenase, partial [Fibrobacteria bacterium]